MLHKSKLPPFPYIVLKNGGVYARAHAKRACTQMARHALF
ncbi:hypothetical protein AB434_3475 [Heyndrickxia coagulans]|nr:hypothetical protein AB434_3475 [Heyndrickxia coagulans]